MRPAAASKRSVLVVDEDPAMREMVLSQLEEEAIGAQSAASVEEALALLRDGGIGCVLSEVHLPHRSGFELLQGVHALGGEVRVILMTPFGDEVEAERARRAGAFDYLAKPFARARLLTAIRQALS